MPLRSDASPKLHFRNGYISKLFPDDWNNDNNNRYEDSPNFHAFQKLQVWSFFSRKPSCFVDRNFFFTHGQTTKKGTLKVIQMYNEVAILDFAEL